MTGSDHALLRTAVHDRDHARGPALAPVTLVEYGDFQCPYCAQAHPIVEALRSRLGDRLRFVFRNFPLARIHPDALHAAEAAESVAEHAGDDAYWVMHHTLFVSRRALDDVHLVGYAAGAGADPGLVGEDLRSGVYEERVRADFVGGIRSGVNATPTFFVNGARFDQDWSDVEAFAAALDAAAGELTGAESA